MGTTRAPPTTGKLLSSGLCLLNEGRASNLNDVVEEFLREWGGVVPSSRTLPSGDRKLNGGCFRCWELW